MSLDYVFVFICGKYAFHVELNTPTETIRYEIEKHGLTPSQYYMIQGGKIFDDAFVSKPCSIHVCLRLLAGKGGFGSMLRAIGAQIEKTTNREACRDLSGRRLRDINEEKRLKTWITQQVEREKEANDRRQKKLERLVQTPKHEFKDDNYEQERSALPDKVEDALEQGLKASSSGNKRKIADKSKQKKKACLWISSDISSSDTDSEDDKEEHSTSNKDDSDSEPAQKIPKINEETGPKPSATVTSTMVEEVKEDISDQLNAEDESDPDKKVQDAVSIN